MDLWRDKKTLRRCEALNIHVESKKKYIHYFFMGYRDRSKRCRWEVVVLAWATTVATWDVAVPVWDVVAAWSLKGGVFGPA